MARKLAGGVYNQTMDHQLVLRQGPGEWNGWRRNNPNVVPDLGATDLSGLVLDRANLDDAVLFEAVLANASFVGASLRRAVLQGADLRGANLRSADLSDADLSGTWGNPMDHGARRKDPTLRLSYPTGADLRKACLHDTLFARTNLRGCNFSGARLNRTVFSDVNLSLAQGLEDAIHEGPSQVTVSTLAQSRGVLSRAFFSTGGVPENILRSVLALKPGEAAGSHYYSCFISHSSQDADFAHKLAERLTNAGVVVWHDEFNVQGGRSLEDLFSDAIRASDKLVLVVSESSLASPWVEYEVARAKEREEETSDRPELRRSLLFPILLLSMEQFNSILKHAPADTHFNALRHYHMRDFRRWQEPECFDSACQAMIRDLTKDE